MQQYNELNKVILQEDTIFVNFENSKTSDPQSYILNILNTINLKGSDKYVALSYLSTIHEKK